MIINADDLGMSESINNAIVFCLSNEIINRSTLMVNMPYCADAVEKIKTYSLNRMIGLHLNLTEGVPLTNEILNTDFCRNGQFTGGIFEKHLFSKLYLNKYTRNAVKKELKAQIDKFISLNINNEIHIDSHQHIHMKKSILDVLIPLLKEYNIKSIRNEINIPQDKISVKYWYRSLLNRKIKQYDSSDIKFAGGIAAFDEQLKRNNKILKNKAEIWIHPDFVDGILIDRFYPVNIIEFKKKWSI